MRLINADALIMTDEDCKNTTCRKCTNNIVNCEDLQDLIANAQTVDAVEVVRCRDCIHCADDYVDTGFGAMPTFTCDIFEGYGVGIKPDHYCSYGERGESDA